MSTVVVIGGGITGCGVARDLSMRGASVILIEQGKLNSGTSGRSHNLLHSGARYAESDAGVATECWEESQILRAIGGACIDQTGGIFVRNTGDSIDYFDRKVAACHSCGIPVRVLDREEVMSREPSLNDAVTDGFLVPDSVIYADRLLAATIHSAIEHGATVLTETEVIDISMAKGTATGVRIARDATDETTITADFVVNATGPWAGLVCGLADIELSMNLTRGTMIYFDSPPIRTVINRCRPPSSGDILVPYRSGVIAGTTSEPVPTPDSVENDLADADELRAEVSHLVPALTSAPVRTTYQGVRPLFDPESTGAGRGQSRDHHVIDHENRDGIQRFITIVGGKLTTHRLMAKDVADQVSQHLDISSKCKTKTAPLSKVDDPAKLNELVAKLDIHCEPMQ